jgi:serine/threonine protein kinase
MAGARAFIGKMIGGYRVGAEISTTSLSCVYWGEQDTPTERIVAIKLWHALHLSPHKQHQFLQEVRLLKMLKHPHLLPILDSGIDEDMPYLVTAYAARGSLRDRIEEQPPRPVPLQEALTILSQVGQALQYVHQLHLTHANLTPENMLFSAQGEALLADLTVRTLLEDSSSVYPHHVRKACYMAPEQFQGVVSAASDQYALGCLAYELLTGRVPFTASDFSALGRKHAEESPLAPTLLNMLLPLRMEEAILKALSKKQEDRHASVEDFLTALGPASLFQARSLPIPVTARAAPPVLSSSPPFAQLAGPGDIFWEIRQQQGEEAGQAEAPEPPGKGEEEIVSRAASPTGVPEDRAMEQVDLAEREMAGSPVLQELPPQHSCGEQASLPVTVPVKAQAVVGKTVPIRDGEAHPSRTRRRMGSHRGEHRGSRRRWLTIIAIIFVTTIIALFSFAALAARSSRTTGQVTPQAPSAVPSVEPSSVPSPLPSATPSRTPSLTPSSFPQPAATLSPALTPIPGLTVSPGRFDAQTDCPMRGHLYICTAILALAQSAPAELRWSASSSGLRQASFSPSSGTLSASQQQRVQIAVRSDCPATGSLLFSAGGSTVTVMWSC